MLPRQGKEYMATTIGPAKKAAAIGGVMLFVLVVFGAVSAALIPGRTLPGSSSSSGEQANSNTINAAEEKQGFGLTSALQANEQMKEVVRQQMKKEAEEIIQKCIDSGDTCGDLALLEQLCASGSNGNVLGLESCNDPRLQQMLMLQQPKKG
jgi:hypothetical protein